MELFRRTLIATFQKILYSHFTTFIVSRASFKQIIIIRTDLEKLTISPPLGKG